MKQGGGTGFVFFIDTGRTETTKDTWIWAAEERSERGERATVDELGCKSIPTCTRTGDAEPDNRGVVFMPALYSSLGAGVLGSTDYGKTWTRVGIATNQATVFGTPKRVYAMYAWACGGCKVDPALQSAPQPEISGWTRMATPAGDGDRAGAGSDSFRRHLILTANRRGGIWRFVE